MKKLIGNTDVEDVLQRLDRLTQEEACMTSAELLRISHNVEGRVIRVEEGVQGVDKGVRDVDDKVERVQHEVQDVGDGVKDVQETVQGVDDKVDQLNRESQCYFPDLQLSQTFTGHSLRDCLRTWLSPADPSTNHNLASGARHEGTAQWFFRGTIFNQWKSAGPFLWVHGKRMCALSISMPSDLTISNPIAGSGKSVLWFVHRYHPPLNGTYILM